MRIIVKPSEDLHLTIPNQGKTLEALKLMKKTLNIGLEVFRTPHHSELLQFMSKVRLNSHARDSLDLADVHVVRINTHA